MSNQITTILSALHLDTDNEANLKACQKAMNGQVSKLVGKYLQANKSETEAELDYTIALNQAKLRMRVAKATLSERVESRFAEQKALAQRKASATPEEKALLGISEPVAQTQTDQAQTQTTEAKTVKVEPVVDPVIATIQ